MVRLLRHMARPPVASERLEPLLTGHVEVLLGTSAQPQIFAWARLVRFCTAPKPKKWVSTAPYVPGTLPHGGLGSFWPYRLLVGEAPDGSSFDR